MLIKDMPEDFYVEEVPKNIELTKDGEYCYFTILKRNKNTQDVIKEISKKLNIRERNFNVAGIKDKKAVTKQLVSAYKVSVRNLKRLRIPNVDIEFLGYSDKRIKLGQLEGNKFKIVVRKLEDEGKRISFIENYFDEQRFSGRNALLGKMLVKKEFRKFCYTLRLKWKDADYVNAIRQISKKRLVFYVNAYQSYLWNKAVGEYLKRHLKEYREVDYSQGVFVFSNEKLDNMEVPILGYSTELNGEFKEIYEKIFDEEGIKLEDFLIKELPELISEGVNRKLYADVKGFKVIYEKDERHRDSLKAVMQFFLGPGSYATIVVKKVFS